MASKVLTSTVDETDAKSFADLSHKIYDMKPSDMMRALVRGFLKNHKGLSTFDVEAHVRQAVKKAGKR